MTPAIIRGAGIPGLFDVTIPATGEFLTDLTVGQITRLIAERGLVPMSEDGMETSS